MTESLILAVTYAEESGSLEDIEKVLILIEQYRIERPNMYNLLNKLETEYKEKREKIVGKPKNERKKFDGDSGKMAGWRNR